MVKKPIKPTRAEEFFQEEDSRRVLIQTPHGVVEDTQPPRHTMRLSSNEPCAVDVPLAEALDKGLLKGSVASIRRDLLLFACIVWAGAATAYGQQLAAPKVRERREKAERLNAMIRAFVEYAEDEADTMERLADKGEDESLRPVIATRYAIVNAGEALMTHIGQLLAEPLPDGGDATNWEERTFFTDLAAWWQRSAIDPTRRGASAVRNRMALALWIDFGGKLPGGISETGEEWAKRKFREYGH